MFVHAANENSVGYDRHFKFEPSPTDWMNLQIPIQVVRKSLNESAVETDRAET